MNSELENKAWAWPTCTPTQTSKPVSTSRRRRTVPKWCEHSEVARDTEATVAF
uniref:Uncharacterized protein n=1 Tax=Anguilla anguilla TaxID=7936 RepID=A0A0E9QSF5_ANGAN